MLARGRVSGCSFAANLPFTTFLELELGGRPSLQSIDDIPAPAA